jgi:hypothetical protein
MNYPVSLARVWEQSVGRLSPSARDLLYSLAWMAPRPAALPLEALKVHQDWPGVRAAFNAIASMVHSRFHSIFPIVREGNVFLLAGSPTDMRSIVEPILQRRKERIAEVFKTHLREITLLTKIYKQVVPAGLLHGKTGEFIGGLARGLLGIE